MNIISVRHLNKFFNNPVDFQVLKNINLDVEKGKITSIIGKSGCGKSTLLYLLSTLDTKYEGDIIINNENLKGKDDKWLSNFRNEHIGFVFQFHFLLQEFSVLENVMLPALKLGGRSQEEVKEDAINLLKLLGVNPSFDKKAALISGGEQQRVAIARALINKPSIVMGDEPTGNLDSYNSDIAFGLFRDLCKEFKQTFLIVTHDRDIAEKSDNIIQLKDGEVV